MNLNWQQKAEADIDCRITKLTRLGGGDFAESFHATLEDKRSIFVKTHSEAPPNFFTTEANGLGLLSTASELNIPAVLGVCDSPSYLALEWITSGSLGESTDIDMGRQLASLHQLPHPHFGREDCRTTGSLGLPNEPCTNWSEFYASRRLLPLAKLASDRNALPENIIRKIEQLANRLDSVGGPTAPPSVLHGDLWAGNRMIDEDGTNWLIDPAAHGGHREFDLAMMQLFGGFSEACFDAYNEVFPQETQWQERVPLHQLAPLIVHAIKFGGHYRQATADALDLYR